MKSIPAVGGGKLVETAEPVREVEFACRKCHGSLFYLDWAFYADHSGKAIARCAACGGVSQIMEPRLNGPH